MNIVPARSSCVVGLLALTAAACAGPGPAAPIRVEQRFEAAGLPPVDVRISIQPEHGRVRQRYVAAAMAALKQNGESLGPLRATSLTILDPPLHGSAASSASDVVVLDRTPWWSTAGSMTPELATARAVSRRFWTTLVDTRALPPWLVGALSEYAARRVVAGLFEQEHPPGYAFYEDRYFGGLIPGRALVSLRQESDGDPIPAYRSHPAVAVVPAPVSAADVRSLEGKAVLALGTLERWVGRPTFDQIVTAFVRAPRQGPPTLGDFTRTASEVSGQDLTWFFDDVFRSSDAFDYGVESVTSEPGAGGTFATTVVARRYADGLFTGSSAARVGGFESGRGVTLVVAFSDGQRRSDYWDGRDRARTFRYSSPARAVFAAIDPDRTLLLDLKQTNNSVTLYPQARAAATYWAARWLGWMQQALLNYSALV